MEAEESKVDYPELSLSLINKQVGTISEESSAAFSEEVAVKAAKVSDNFR